MNDSSAAGSVQSPASGPGCWSETLRVHSYDVDFAKRASAEAICRWFLEAAWNHAEQLGIGYAHLARQSRFWVLARLTVQIDLFPTWGEQLELLTWPRGIHGALALRDFELRHPAGKRLAAGTSGWLILDLQTRRPQRLDKVLTHLSPPGIPAALGRNPAKLQAGPDSDTILTTTVRYSDVDVNGHVNSGAYVRWLLDAYSADHHHKHALHRLEVNYLGETHWGDTLSVRTHERAPLEFAQSMSTPDGREVCRAELLWKPVAG